MASRIRTICVCNGGGDCPGLNAVIRARKIESVPLADAIGACKLVNLVSDYVRTTCAVGLRFGDRP
jgi:hypothetical protein